MSDDVPALEARGLTVRRGGHTLLSGVDLAVPAGTTLVLLGPNGAGKTTLLRAFLGLDRPTAGEVRVEGRPASSWGARDLAGALGWLPQHRRLQEPVTALERVAAARFRFDEPRATSLAAARDALAALEADTLTDRPLPELSGGESQRVALAALHAQEARTWLLDEPANHLDPGVQRAVWCFLEGRRRAGTGLVLVSHDPDVLALLSEGGDVIVAGVRDGRLVGTASSDAPDLAALLESLYGLPVHAVVLDGRRRWLLGVP